MGTGVDGESRPPSRPAEPVDRVVTLPNALSVVRLLLLPVFVWLLVEDRLVAAGGVLALSGITDYLDGRIARAYGLVSRVGQLLDPVADRLYIATTLLGLAWVDVIPWWLVVVLMARDAFVLGMYPVVRRHRLPIPEVDFTGKTATFSLLAAFPLLVLGDVAGWWTVASRVVGWALVWWGIAFYWVAGGVYAWQVRHMVGQRREREVPR